jgi:hypothetical protein
MHRLQSEHFGQAAAACCQEVADAVSALKHCDRPALLLLLLLLLLVLNNIRVNSADLCKQASDAHQKCYMSVINTGYYQVGSFSCCNMPQQTHQQPQVCAVKLVFLHNSLTAAVQQACAATCRMLLYCLASTAIVDRVL